MLCHQITEQITTPSKLGLEDKISFSNDKYVDENVCVDSKKKENNSSKTIIFDVLRNILRLLSLQFLGTPQNLCETRVQDRTIDPVAVGSSD